VETAGAATLAIGALIAVAASAWVVAGPAAAGLATMVVGAAGGLWVSVQGRRAIASLGARELREGEEPRLVNLVRGIAADISLAPPLIFVFDSGGPNALVCRARGPAVVVARSLLESYTRTELEAVVAHCLLRLAHDGWLAAAVAVGLGPLGRRIGPRRGTADDVRAACLTRYPPALSSAIAKAELRQDAFSPFWFAAAGPWHRAGEPRRKALSEL